MEKRPDRFTALIDACVLVGALQRNIILTLAEADIFRIRWSERILGELEHSLVTKVLKHSDEQVRSQKAFKLRRAMTMAFDEASVDGFEEFEAVFQDLPDPDDAHVAAAAVRCAASVIVTENLRDFPPDRFGKLDITIRTPDMFIADAIDLEPIHAPAAIRRMRERLRRPSMTPARLIEIIDARGMPMTAEMLRGFIEQI